jgi:hypothetical protein
MIKPSMQSSSHEPSITSSGRKEGTEDGATQLAFRNKSTFAEMAQKIIDEAQKNKNVKKVRIRVRVRRLVKGGKSREKAPRKVAISGEIAAKLLKQRVIALKQKRAKYTSAKQKSNNILEPAQCIDLTQLTGNETVEVHNGIDDPANAASTSPVQLPSYMVHPTTHSYCPITESVIPTGPNHQQPEAMYSYMQFNPPSFQYEPLQPMVTRMEETQQHPNQERQEETRTISDHVMNIEEI